MTVKRKKDNFFLPHVWAFIILRLKWITYIPNRIYIRVNRWGWKLVFWLMLNSAKRLEKSLKPIEKYIVFRNWGWKQVIKWMTKREGWVMAITHPKAEHMEQQWACVTFSNPKYLEVDYEVTPDGETVVKSVGTLPLHDHLVTNWYLTPEQVEKVGQAKKMLVSDLIEELEE